MVNLITSARASLLLLRGPYPAASSKKNTFTSHALLRKQCLKLEIKKTLRKMGEAIKYYSCEIVFNIITLE
jgi:hypothetical protein